MPMSFQNLEVEIKGPVATGMAESAGRSQCAGRSVAV